MGSIDCHYITDRLQRFELKIFIYVPLKKQSHLHLGCPGGKQINIQFSFLVNFTFKFKTCKILEKGPHALKYQTVTSEMRAVWGNKNKARRQTFRSHVDHFQCQANNVGTRSHLDLRRRRSHDGWLIVRIGPQTKVWPKYIHHAVVCVFVHDFKFCLTCRISLAFCWI